MKNNHRFLMSAAGLFGLAVVIGPIVMGARWS